MVKLLGASPGTGILIGTALLLVGLFTGRVLLAVAGGFVLVASLLHWINRIRSHEHGNDQPMDERHR